MRFFRRDTGGTTAPTDFWRWWPGARERIAGAIESGGLDQPLIGEISGAVSSIDPGMAWELGPGRSSRYAFCVSPEGNAALRQAALRWLAAAPPVDATWEYHASKQAAPTLTGLQVANHRFELDEMRAIASWDSVRRRLDVRLWHPQFDGVPPPVRLQVAFVFLDNLLGEEDVERWIGQIDLLEAPTGGRTPSELKAEIGRRMAEPTDQASWIVAEFAGPDGRPHILSADLALKRIDHPFADHHVRIEQVFGADRMPTAAELAQLDREEEDFLDRLGGVAILAARVTAPGSRTLHFVAQDPDGLRPAIDGWAQELPDSLSPGLPQRRLKVNFARDMDWSFQRDLGIR
jgi:hypothetical protein